MATEHGDTITDNVRKAADFVDDKTGGRFEKQIDKVEGAAERAVDKLDQTPETSPPPKTPPEPPRP